MITIMMIVMVIIMVALKMIDTTTAITETTVVNMYAILSSHGNFRSIFS